MSSLDLTFVACNRNPDLFRNDPSFIYRCENRGLALEEQRHDVRFAHITGLRKMPASQVIVFHRPRANAQLWFLLRKLRQSGAILIADVDDLIVDEKLVAYSPGVRNGLVSESRIKRLFRAHRRALSQFDGITVSTVPLAEQVKRLVPNARVEVIPNGVHLGWRQKQLPGQSPAAERTITYLPGTRSHNRDFAQIAKPLSRFLREHPEVRLEITGPLEFSLDALPGQVVHLPRVPFEQYCELVRRGWLNLAPLEDTPFNRCKSALKVLEAGYWGIPTICSPNPDNMRFRGIGALIADTPQAWLNALERMLDDTQYSQVTQGLRERTLALADVKQHAERFIAFACSLKT